MCGRGDLSVLRVCRRLRVRVPAARVANTVAPLTHGAQVIMDLYAFTYIVHYIWIIHRVCVIFF